MAVIAQITEDHRLAQVRLAAETVDRMRLIWPLLDMDDLDGTYQRWLRVAVPIIQRQRGASAHLAAAYYRQVRAVTMPLGAADFTPIADSLADSRAVATSLLVTGPYSLKRAVGEGVLRDRASEVAMTRSARAASRHVLDGGRGTVQRSVEADRAALGFARVGSGATCGFCAMLISRGPVYKTEESATARSDGSRFHDNCHCAAEPVFDRDDWGGKAQYEHFHALWQDNKTGKTSAEARKSFRRLVEA